MTREEFEAAVWRALGPAAAAAPGAVAQVLIAADGYAAAESGRLLAARLRYLPPLDASLAGARRAALRQPWPGEG